MNTEKVIQKMTKFDLVLTLTPPILSFLGGIASLIIQPDGGFLILPIFLIYSVIFSGLYLTIGLIAAFLLRNKLAFRILLGVMSLPVLYIAFELIIFYAKSLFVPTN